MGRLAALGGSGGFTEVENRRRGHHARALLLGRRSGAIDRAAAAQWRRAAGRQQRNLDLIGGFTATRRRPRHGGGGEGGARPRSPSMAGIVQTSRGADSSASLSQAGRRRGGGRRRRGRRSPATSQKLGSASFVFGGTGGDVGSGGTAAPPSISTAKITTAGDTSDAHGRPVGRRGGGGDGGNGVQQCSWGCSGSAWTMGVRSWRWRARGSSGGSATPTDTGSAATRRPWVDGHPGAVGRRRAARGGVISARASFLTTGSRRMQFRLPGGGRRRVGGGSPRT